MTSMTQDRPRVQHPGHRMLSATRTNYRFSVQEQLWNLRDLARLTTSTDACPDPRTTAWRVTDAEMHAMIRAEAWREAAAGWAVCIADAAADEGGDVTVAVQAYKACRARRRHWSRRATQLHAEAIR